MEQKVFQIYDVEDLWNMVSELVFALFMNGMMLDEEGNYVGYDEQKAHIWEYLQKNPQYEYLDFSNCGELQGITLQEATELTVQEIKARYLSATLPIARKVMRSNCLLVSYGVPDESISDDYLDALFALAWKEELKMWALQRDRKREG